MLQHHKAAALAGGRKQEIGIKSGSLLVEPRHQPGREIRQFRFNSALAVELLSPRLHPEVGRRLLSALSGLLA